MKDDLLLGGGLAFCCDIVGALGFAGWHLAGVAGSPWGHAFSKMDLIYCIVFMALLNLYCILMPFLSKFGRNDTDRIFFVKGFRGNKNGIRKSKADVVHGRLRCLFILLL